VERAVWHLPSQRSTREAGWPLMEFFFSRFFLCLPAVRVAQADVTFHSRARPSGCARTASALLLTNNCNLVPVRNSVVIHTVFGTSPDSPGNPFVVAGLS
jgi:hypothetical protein